MHETEVSDLKWFLINLRGVERQYKEWAIIKSYTNLQFLKDLMINIGGKEKKADGILWPKLKQLMEQLLTLRDQRK